jgi:hypothetical protein
MKETRMKSYKEQAEELDQLKDSGREMEGMTPVRAKVAKDLRSVISIRLSSAEREAIQAAVERLRAQGENTDLSTFIREAALTAAAPDSKTEIWRVVSRLKLDVERLEEQLTQMPHV